MSRKPKQHTLHLTQKAVSDLLEIESFFIARWGKRTAKRYLADIEEGLKLIRENPAFCVRWKARRRHSASIA